MKKPVSIFLTVVLSLCCCFAIAACGKGGDSTVIGKWTVTSPDGSLTATVETDSAGGIYYSVNKGEVPVVNRSALGISIEEDDFDLFEVVGCDIKAIEGEYDNISGKRSRVAYACNELTMTVRAWEFTLDVVMRCYDDGYAFRYRINPTEADKSGAVTVTREKTEFALPSGSVVWAQPFRQIVNGQDFFAYEDTYQRMSLDSLGGVKISMPMLYKIKGAEVYSMITESGLVGSGFYGSFLTESEENRGKGILGTVHAAGIAHPDNLVSYPFTSPWRVGIVGDLATVVESELVEKVYDDTGYWNPDDYASLPYEEQKIFDYDWVEPGVAAWNWLIYTHGSGEKLDQNNWALQKKYVDLAADMHWKYTVLDGNWDKEFSAEAFRDFMDYAGEKGVKVIVWCNALVDFGNGNRDALCEKLDFWEGYGVAGIKIDFFDGQNAINPSHMGEDIETVEWYETIYQETARRKMIVNAHGSNKPTGERRLYPHVVNREAIRGNEWIHLSSSATVNSMFVRAVVGPTDFTPVVKPMAAGLTTAHQMALAVLYECGLPSMADYAETYYDYRGRLIDLYRNIPAARDETKFLSGTPDGYYCGAVKSGNQWFVAGINSVVPEEIMIDFSFLEEGDYEAYYYKDDGQGGITRERATVNQNTAETVSMLADGGFVMHLKKI